MVQDLPGKACPALRKEQTSHMHILLAFPAISEQVLPETLSNLYFYTVHKRTAVDTTTRIKEGYHPIVRLKLFSEPGTKEKLWLIHPCGGLTQ